MNARLLQFWSIRHVDWVEPFEFEDTFEIVDYYRGRSAAGIELKSLSTGGNCCLMMKDLIALIKHVVNGKVSGRWKYKKRGQNYFVEFLGPEEIEKDHDYFVALLHKELGGKFITEKNLRSDYVAEEE